MHEKGCSRAYVTPRFGTDLFSGLWVMLYQTNKQTNKQTYNEFYTVVRYIIMFGKCSYMLKHNLTKKKFFSPWLAIDIFKTVIYIYILKSVIYIHI